MDNFKKYWVEIILIIGYLIADNLHMYIEHISYSPNWYAPPWENYNFNDSVFFTLHYFAQLPLLITFIFFRYSPKDVHRQWLRLLMLLASLRDFLGELFEMMNINLTFFSNEGYNKTCYVKISILLIALLIPLKMKKMCLNLLRFLSSP